MMPSLTIHKVTAENVDQIQKLTLHESQHAFVSPIWKMLAGLEGKTEQVPFAIYEDEKAIGFFIINFDYSEISHYADPEECCGLEGFFIDKGWQGRGLGKPSIIEMKNNLQEEFPEYRKVNLTVNCENPAAIKTYLNAGFEDTGRLYHGGRSGPQHIFTMKLNWQLGSSSYEQDIGLPD